MEASGGSGNLFSEVLHWLWLPILLGSAAALLTTPEWRRGAASHTRTLAALAAVAVIVELAWRLAAPAAPPLAAWAAALFVFSLALSALDTRRRAATQAADADTRRERPAPSPAAEADDPFRPETAAPAASRELTSLAELSLAQAADAIAVFDAAGRIELVNPAWARLHGFRPDEVLGHHLSLFHTPDQMRRQVRPAMDEARGSGGRAGVVEHRRKDGSTFFARTTLALLRRAGGEAAGFVAVARELGGATGEPPPSPSAGAAEHEVETLQVLVGSVAHELNNLLTGILGNASLLADEMTPAAGGEIREIEEGSRRAAELARVLQTYAGRTRAAAESLGLSELVRDSSATLEAMVGARASLRLDLDATLPKVAADPAQLRLVLSKLVANAAEAAGDAGCEITVRTGRIELDRERLDRMLMGSRRAPGTYAFLEVADNGEGVDDEGRSRMFEPFYSTRPGHRGLGLAAVLGVVRGHRGAIAVDSAPAAGTRLRVVLPASERAPPRRAGGGEPATAPPSATKTRRQGEGTILVVDNERVIRELASSVLQPRGFAILTADDGEPALELYRAHHCEIRAVLLDLTMPLMDGQEVFRRIRKIDSNARVILMTGHDADDVRKEFAGTGLAAVLQKPFRPADLVGLLGKVLA